MEGRKPEGRQASLDPASVLPLAALRELQKGDAVNIPLFGGETVSGFVVASKFEENGWLNLSIKLVGDRKGFVGFGSNGKKFGGTIDFPGEQIACRIMERPDGGMVVKEVTRSEIICIMPARKTKASREPRSPPPEAESIPILSSRPEATAVLYLDFDGETVEGARCNSEYNDSLPIVAEPAGFSAAEITEIWEIVSEDYAALRY